MKYKSQTRLLFSYFLVVILTVALINTIRCDLYLFDKENQNQQDVFKKTDGNLDSNSEQYDRLYLFPESSNCNKKLLDGLNKKTFCSDYCTSLFEEKSKNCTPSVADNNDQENYLNISGVLNLYRSFISKFVSQIPDSSGEAMSFNLKIELTSHEIHKLDQFSKSNVDAEALAHIQDTTDILKSMYLSMMPSQLDEYKASLSYLMNAFRIESQFNLIVLTLVVFVISYFVFFRQRYPISFSLKNVLIIAFIVFFTMSAMSNHKLLNQKKQIKKQQTLKLAVPEECLNDQTDPKHVSMFSHFKAFLGYTATSKQCLDYQEALFIDLDHTNYIETIIFTLTDSVRPIAVGFGEFINNFYSSLTKDLHFWQYMPLTGCITLIALPLCVYFLSLFSMILFGYEFSFFFNCISFRRSQQPPSAPVQPLTLQTQQAISDTHSAQLLALIAKLSNENDKLITDSNKLKMIESTTHSKKQTNASFNERIRKLKAIEPPALSETLSEDKLNDSLANHFEVYISNVNSKEEEHQKEISELKAQIEKLKLNASPAKTMMSSLSPVLGARKNIINEQQQQQNELESSSEQEKENIKISTPQQQNLPQNNKIVSIGLSKTVLNPNRLNALNNNNKLNASFKRTKERELLQESNDSNTAFDDTEDDDADDIFVILEDN